MSQCMKHIAFDLCIKKVLVQDGKIEKKKIRSILQQEKFHYKSGNADNMQPFNPLDI